MGGLFMPEKFHMPESSLGDIKIISIAWGFQLGFSILTGAKAASQAIKIWKRTGRITGYVAMVWIEILANPLLGLFTRLFMNGSIEASFGLFFSLVLLWSIELHLLVQIIVNRRSLLIQSRKRKLWIKWGSAAIILVINIGVYCIWIPARLQISQTYININNIFDRAGKVAYLILDAALNYYFCYPVKSKLINAGMTKYMPLYKFNVAIVFVSLSMDVLLIGMMSLQNSLIYTQFHGLTFMIKLNIEMSMAHMISKIARAPRQGVSYSGEHSVELKMSAVSGSQEKKGASKATALTGTTFAGTASRERKFNPTLSEIECIMLGFRGPQSPVSKDVEAGIGDSRAENHIRKNTTVQITTEMVDDEVPEKNRRAPGESDSMKALTKHSGP